MAAIATYVFLPYIDFMPSRSDRFDFRLTNTNRRLIERAAKLVGLPLTAFAVQALVERAEAVVASETQRRLSARDWKRFVQIIESDELPAGLARAVRKSRAG